MDGRYPNILLKLVNDSAQIGSEVKELNEIGRDRLINTLNRINFQNGEIVLNFRHIKHHSLLSIPVWPQPCSDKNLVCNWLDSFQPDKKLDSYIFDHFHITDGFKKILVKAELKDIFSQCVKLGLPEKCFEINSREARRYKCHNISVCLSQKDVVVEGVLKSYSTVAFSVFIPRKPKSVLQNIDRGAALSIILRKEPDCIYTENCEIFRTSQEPDGFKFILRPIKNQIQRSKPKQHRSVRQELIPMPCIIFDHPFIGKKINFRASDISGSGFSVEENIENSTLIPGIIIPKLIIKIANNAELTCKAQIVYRNVDDYGKTKCGFAFLDMSLKDQLSLSALLHQAKKKNIYICAKIDMDKLWHFFFDSGFIYPEKYQNIAAQKDKLESTFRNIYKGNPEIAQHIIYQDNSQILGHIAIYRFYQKTWLLHHLAAIKSAKNKAGIVVLKHIFRHINEIHSLPSAKMKYLIGYFRPENRFSCSLFGPKTVQIINDLNKCSVDEFSYSHIVPRPFSVSPSSSWKLTDSDQKDLTVLKLWYDKISGGLTIKALDLTTDNYWLDSQVTHEYERAGLKRDRKIFSLKKNGDLIAILVVNISDFGLNMSDLTNCIQVFVLEEERIDSNTLYYYVLELSSHYADKNIPVLLFPKTYADSTELSYEKTYMLGILNLEFIDDYLEFKHYLI